MPTTSGERCLSVIRETEYKRLRFLWSVLQERAQGAQAQERGGQTTLRGLKANRRQGYEWRQNESCAIRAQCDYKAYREKLERNHNSYSTGVIVRSGVVTRESIVCAITICSVSRRTLSTLTESGCLSSVRDLSPQKQTSCWQKHKICRV